MVPAAGARACASSLLLRDGRRREQLGLCEAGGLLGAEGSSSSAGGVVDQQKKSRRSLVELIRDCCPSQLPAASSERDRLPQRQTRQPAALHSKKLRSARTGCMFPGLMGRHPVHRSRSLREACQRSSLASAHLHGL